MFDQLRKFINVEELATRFVEYLPSLVAALIIVFGAYLFYRITKKVLVATLKKMDFQATLIRLLVENVYRYVVLFVGFVMAADQLGIDITTALAGVGVFGIAVGFAAQDAVANVISGILIFWDKPFKVGDWIETEDEYGRVTDITLRTTRIRTPRNTYVVIPNKRIIDEVLENYTKHGELRVDVPVGIAYKENIDAARNALLDAATEHPKVQSEPAPDVIVEELAGSSVNLKLRVWIENADDFKAVYFNLLEQAKNALDGADIEIPFPHLQLHVDGVAEPVMAQVAKLRA